MNLIYAVESIYFALWRRLASNPKPPGLMWRFWATTAFVLAALKHSERGNRDVAKLQWRAASWMILAGLTK